MRLLHKIAITLLLFILLVGYVCLQVETGVRLPGILEYAPGVFTGAALYFVWRETRRA